MNRPMMRDKDDFDLEQMEKETNEMLRLTKLDGNSATFSRSEGGFISLTLSDGTLYKRVTFYMAFPFSDPSRYISVREATEKAKEIGIIINLDEDIPREQADLIKESIGKRYFMPKISKINSVKEDLGYAYFDVETDFGRILFAANNASGSVIPLGETRLILTDLDGNRFEIEDITKLSPKEQKKLDVFM